MSRDIKNELRDFLKTHYMPHSAYVIKDEDSFLKKGIIDSIGVIELVSHVQNFYNIKVRPQEIIPDNFDSIDKLSAFISRKQ